MLTISIYAIYIKIAVAHNRNFIWLSPIMYIVTLIIGEKHDTTDWLSVYR